MTACLFVTGMLLAPHCAVAVETSVMAEKADSVYGVVDELAHFPGGDEALMSFLTMNLHYPEAMRQQGKSGRVFVTFEISKKGKIRNPRIIKTPDEGFNEEVIRFMKSMPKWKPAKVKGKKVTSRMILPLMFRLPR